MNNRRRSRLLVDPKLQLILAGKAVGYWGLGFLILSGPIVLFEVHPGLLVDQNGWSLIRPVFITWLALLPIVLVSVMKQSNKFVAPIIRLRRSMRQLANGERVEPLHFRKRDFWHEIAEDFNALLQRVERQQQRDPSEDTTPELVEETSSV